MLGKVSQIILLYINHVVFLITFFVLMINFIIMNKLFIE